MKYRISILCDNTVGALSGTLGEHGFAALVEWDGGSLLFDTGQGATLLLNARRMNRDLHKLGQVALSHGHCGDTACRSSAPATVPALPRPRASTGSSPGSSSPSRWGSP